MNENIIQKIVNDFLQDKILDGDSIKWANWKSELSFTTCILCAEKHGTIIDIAILKRRQKVNNHAKCKCIYVPMRTKTAGKATNMGYSGADSTLFYLNKLPDYYITKENAKKHGWRNYKGNLDKVLPGKMIGGDRYRNKEKKLPDAIGREWYEADINYDSGYRNRQRVLYSNDGLIFVTYDHCQTFYEVIK